MSKNLAPEQLKTHETFSNWANLPFSMKWIGRILLVLAFFSLGALAVWPYIEPAREKWHRFREAWESVNRDPAVIEETEFIATEQTAPAGVRERSVQLPETVTAEANLLSENEDPFLMEARRRAQENPAAAMAWLQAEASSKDRLRGMLEIVALWAAEDAENALL